MTTSNADQDRRYPIYRIRMQWTEDGVRDGERPAWWPDDPGEGRVWNGTEWYEMYREEQDTETLVCTIRDKWWPQYCEVKSPQNPSTPRIHAEYSHRESWCPGWFQHWTFDDAQADIVALESFDRYVARHTFYQQWYPWDEEADQALARRGVEKRIVLMGAEDRWRWRAGKNDDEYAPPPCRCEHCRAQGKIRINH